MSYVYTYSYPTTGIPFYVGVGTRNRLKSHINNAKKGKRDGNWIKCNILQKLLNNNEYPKIEKITGEIDRELALLIEIEYIDKYGRQDIGTGILSNMTDGGDGSSNCSPEVNARRAEKFGYWSKNIRVIDDAYKLAISNGLKEYYVENPLSQEAKDHLRNIFSGENGPFYGRKHSEESKLKNSLSHVGIFPSAETRLKKSIAGKRLIGELNGFYGKKHRDESKRSISKSLYNFSIENNKNGIDHFNIGKKHSDETIKKLKIERTCIHCGLTGNGSAMKRWHFNNCKLFKQETLI